MTLPRPEGPPDERAALLDALSYLVDEAEMLRAVLPGVPEALRRERARADVPALHEALAELAQRDQARLKQVNGMLAHPAVPYVDDNVNVLIDHVQAAREALIAALETRSVAEWRDLARAAITDDAALLRAAIEPIYDARGFGGPR